MAVRTTQEGPKPAKPKRRARARAVAAANPHQLHLEDVPRDGQATAPTTVEAPRSEGARPPVAARPPRQRTEQVQTPAPATTPSATPSVMKTSPPESVPPGKWSKPAATAQETATVAAAPRQAVAPVAPAASKANAPQRSAANRAAVEVVAPVEAAPSVRKENTVANRALRTIVSALFRDFGLPGSTLQHPTGASFALRQGLGEGEVKAHPRLTVPLPEGMATWHEADLAVEMADGRLLVLDVVPSHMAMAEIKSRCFDALQYQSKATPFLVFVRCPGPGLTQEQMEALGHGYRYIFGVSEEHIQSEMRFDALRGEIAKWLAPAAD